MPGQVLVLAGTNGAGKSSIGGELLSASGQGFYNPDIVARHLASGNRGMSQQLANAEAWLQGRLLLERAIARRGNFAFETTLGGASMTALLRQAADAGLDVRIWYAGLASVELHIERVRRRVAKGGHDIPETTIRRRFDDSRRNLIGLLPHLAELKAFDNSAEGDPDAGVPPAPALVLHLRDRRIVGPSRLERTPQWAKPIVAAAVTLVGKIGGG